MSPNHAANSGESPVATLEDSGRGNLAVTQASDRPEPRGAIKFTYPSGSRPLEGYTIKRGVGRGGFGEVYFATSDGGKEVALKLIRRNLDVELRGVSHCLNLKHPHLVGLYDIRQDEGGDSWVIMEFVAGESLEQIVSRSPEGMPIPEVLAWMHGIGAGVGYLHDRGIVHRDLKPGNIFCDEGIVKIGDYGLSKFISASRRSGQTESVGTVHYMAPEVANGRYGKEIDIYALGIMLYEMLTGHVPFEGESVGEVLMKHLTAEPDLSKLSEPFRTVVARALTKDPDKRFKNVGEMLALLPQPALPNVMVNPQATKPRTEEPVQATAEPLVAVQVVNENEEPIWRAVRDAWRQLTTAWNNSKLGTPARVLIMVAVVYLLVQTAPVWMFSAVFAVVCYGVYRVVRAMLIASNPAPPPTSRPPTPNRPAAPQPSPQPQPQRTPSPQPAAQSPFVAAAVQAPRPVQPRRHWTRPPERQPVLPIKTPREKMTELLGSMLLSALVTTVACVVMALFLTHQPEFNQFAWLALVGTVGSWCVLIPSKLWEGREGDTTLRRFVLLLVGLGLGLFAYEVDKLLMVDLPRLVNVSGFHGDYQSSLMEGGGAPSLNGYLAYFAFLFPILRWWKQADPLRGTRLGVWATLVCATWAWLLNLAWPFPQPWGVMVAATIAIAVQLSSPWVDLKQRRGEYA